MGMERRKTNKWDRVLERYNYRCDICGVKLHRNKERYKDDDYCHFDHIVPKSHGGTSKESNMRAICKACNSSRGNRYGSHLIKLIKHNISETSVSKNKRIELLEGDLRHDLVTISELLELREFIESYYKNELAIIEKVISKHNVCKEES